MPEMARKPLQSRKKTSQWMLPWIAIPSMVGRVIDRLYILKEVMERVTSSFNEQLLWSPQLLAILPQSSITVLPG